MNMNRRKGVLPIFLFMLVFATWILWAMNAVAQTWPRPGTIGCGYYHTVGLKTDGTVVAVGWNYYGELDVDSWTGIVQVSAGYAHTVGLKTDGTVVGAGYSHQGLLFSWTDIVQVSAGYGHIVGLKADGTVVGVGYNNYGERNVGSWTDIVQVSAGGHHTVGLKTDGTVVAVGYNGDGQLDVDSDRYRPGERWLCPHRGPESQWQGGGCGVELLRSARCGLVDRYRPGECWW